MTSPSVPSGGRSRTERWCRSPVRERSAARRWYSGPDPLTLLARCLRPERTYTLRDHPRQGARRRRDHFAGARSQFPSLHRAYVTGRRTARQVPVHQAVDLQTAQLEMVKKRMEEATCRGRGRVRVALLRDTRSQMEGDAGCEFIGHVLNSRPVPRQKNMPGFHRGEDGHYSSAHGVSCIRVPAAGRFPGPLSPSEHCTPGRYGSDDVVLRSVDCWFQPSYFPRKCSDGPVIRHQPLESKTVSILLYSEEVF